MTRKSFAHVCDFNVVFLFIAAFTLVATFAASAQETGSAPDYDRSWQHFAQSGAGECQALRSAGRRATKQFPDLQPQAP